MDFGVLPPEINSGRMYAGPGSGPMMAAAAAWDSLAAELGLAAGGYRLAISELTAHLEAVQPRHHDIQDQRVGAIAGNHVERLNPVVGQFDRIAIEGKRPAQRLAHRTIVVNDKNSHGHQCRRSA